MAKTKTSFNKDNQPKTRKPRGKSERKKILDSFERLSRSEDEFYDLLTERAFDPEDKFSFKELMSRLSPTPKQIAPYIEFKFTKKAKPHEQALEVLTAVSKGQIPPDLGHIFIVSIQSMLKIQEVTDIEERLKKMEDQIDSSE